MTIQSLLNNQTKSQRIPTLAVPSDLRLALLSQCKTDPSACLKLADQNCNHNNFQSSNKLHPAAFPMNSDKTKKIISGYSYFLRDKIGRGSSSEVFRGACQKTSEPVAIKVVSLATAKSSLALASITSEIDFLNMFKGSPHIIQIKNAIQTKNNLYIVTEICEDGTLELNLQKAKRYDQIAAISIVQQIISAYREIGGKGIIHRDLKPSNIMRKGNSYKVGDFGYAVPEDLCQQPQNENVGSPLYMPLQSLASNLYSHKSDIWAIGIIFIELLTGRTPWKARTEKELIKELEAFDLDSIVPKNISKKSKEFLQRVLVKDVEKRMSLEQLAKWSFKETNTEEVLPLNRLKSMLEKPPTLRHFSSIEKKTEKENLSQTTTLKNISQTTQATQLSKNSSVIAMTESELIDSQVIAYRPMSHKVTQKCFQSQKKMVRSIEASLPLDDQLVRKGKSMSFAEQNHNNILSQVQAQINYLRYLLKILNKLNDYVKTKDAKIMDLKNNLLSLAYEKMAEIKDLRHIKGASCKEKEIFLKSKHFSGIESALAKYSERCRAESNKFELKMVLNNQRQFLSILSHSINLLYSNVRQLRANLEQLERKKTLVFILEDLIILSNLYLLEREEHWLNFRDKSAINTHLLKSHPKQISATYIKDLQARFLQLSKN